MYMKEDITGTLRREAKDADGNYSEERHIELLKRKRDELQHPIEVLLETWKAYSLLQANFPAKYYIIKEFRDAEKKIKDINAKIVKLEGDLILIIEELDRRSRK